MFKHSQNQLVTQSQQRISQAMMKLLATESFAELTVTQICQEAEVGRKTFYRNFDDKMDVIAFYLYDEMQQERKTNRPTNLSEAMQKAFVFIYHHQETFKLLDQNDLLPQLQRIIKHLIQNHINELENKLHAMGIEDKIAYYVNFTANTIYSNIELWVGSDFKESPDEIAQLTVNFLSGLRVAKSKIN
ncbi:TetR/AcrR family transcriptional regulator [Limosilactobacillus gastricus]|uniref:TetR/AcrR family transcriptional regulator n=1 Tax=Limosilactobacillus gastricus TaxID=227942 RepID=UPI0002FDEDD9|nr:TetR/AcrR family transcriptional regulator [Limosilactobacillus gastricus]